jgi:uncharacterized protein (DUF4415 family)
MRDEYDFSKGKRGPVLSDTGKTRITIMLDDDVIAGFRSRAQAVGCGYQTEINRALRDYLRGQPLTLEAVRQVIREELHATVA